MYAIFLEAVMGISELITGFISTPGKVINYVQENVLRSPKSLKRRREDSTDGGKQDQRVSRLRLSLPEPDDKAGSRVAALTGTSSLHLEDGAAAAGEVVSPPAPWLQKQRAVQPRAYKAPSGGAGYSSPAIGKQTVAVAAQPRPIELWSSIRARRHGPQTGFRPFHSTATPAKAAASPMLVRRNILRLPSLRPTVSHAVLLLGSRASTELRGLMHGSVGKAGHM